MLVMIDNYDSFTYNLVQYFGQLGVEAVVHRNDQIDLEGLERLQPTRLVISPGPCSPKEAGISMAAISHFAGRIPILGVCLGHQAIGAAFGGEVIRAPRLMHGKTSLIYHDGKDIFQGIPSPFEATRYHSLIVKRDNLPDCLKVSAQTAVGEIMGLRHQQFAIFGVQFHPESILTAEGINILRNFLMRQRG
ncbi:MAG: aminodeoxychorismate/anthranilate synthase component II [Syntrophales bacterium]|nr:aminodeoxychorismate/anthranilate synthase component II [Syntrophales bacterium]MDD5643748.1 aminodeoxychorismate/anthranilate synthase component II [Syntrophales bacterium]